MTTPLGEFGPPPDIAAWSALVLAVVVALVSKVGLFERLAARASSRWVVAPLAVSAAALSYGYVTHYLRGGPRIIDATSYYLEARAFAAGHVAIPLSVPSGAFRGRFLLADSAARHMAVIFPPGYPALLALGVLARAPMLVGPVLAAALVVVTYGLANRIFQDRAAALLAAAFSVVSAVLRYHTADTMSHGWAALLFAGAIFFVLDERPRSAWICGALLGALVATRPVTGALGLALAAFEARADARRLSRIALGAAPCVALFLVEQRVAAGAWLTSTELAYYAAADGPPGCLRYGFGQGVGCVGEHGDFVRAHLSHGYGLVAALGTTLRRLKMHLADAANAEVFFPVLVCAVASAVRRSEARLSALAIVGTVLAYAPFYFDGNYPGGGARFFADALPFEHVLLAWTLRRLAGPAVSVALAGFALHTSYADRSLSAREGGRPMFEPDVVRDGGIRRGLVFVDTDHGFNLGFDPGARVADGVVVARRRHDAHDWVLWQTLGEPPAFEYQFDPRARVAAPRLLPLAMQGLDSDRYEAESEWPPVTVTGGFVGVEFPACASRGRALALHPTGGPVRVQVALEPGRGGRYRLASAWVGTASNRLDAELRVGAATWRVQRALPMGACTVDPGPDLVLERTQILEITSYIESSFDFLSAHPIE